MGPACQRFRRLSLLEPEDLLPSDIQFTDEHFEICDLCAAAADRQMRANFARELGPHTLSRLRKFLRNSLSARLN